MIIMPEPDVAATFVGCVFEDNDYSIATPGQVVSSILSFGVGYLSFRKGMDRIRSDRIGSDTSRFNPIQPLNE